VYCFLQGVNIATFGKLTWEVTEKSITGEEKRRPYFKLAETYCRGNGIPFKKQLKGSALAKAAEINYSILAIRYTLHNIANGWFPSVIETSFQVFAIADQRSSFHWFEGSAATTRTGHR
jgi:hypothetical protein